MLELENGLKKDYQHLRFSKIQIGTKGAQPPAKTK